MCIYTYVYDCVHAYIHINEMSFRERLGQDSEVLYMYMYAHESVYTYIHIYINAPIVSRFSGSANVSVIYKRIYVCIYTHTYIN